MRVLLVLLLALALSLSACQKRDCLGEHAGCSIRCEASGGLRTVPSVGGGYAWVKDPERVEECVAACRRDYAACMK
jgi:hypothetical protein